METRFNIIYYFYGKYGSDHDFNPIPVIIGILLFAIYIYFKAKNSHSNTENRGDHNEEL